MPAIRASLAAGSAKSRGAVQGAMQTVAVRYSFSSCCSLSGAVLTLERERSELQYAILEDPEHVGAAASCLVLAPL